MKSLTKKLLSYITFLVISSGLSGCSASTQLTGSWKSPDATEKHYNKIIVAALTDNVRLRQTVENDLQAQLASRGIDATKSIDVIPPAMMREGGDTSERLMQQIQGDGYDAILTAAVVDEREETRYVAGNRGMYAPIPAYGWYGSFRGYYSHWAPTFYDPGYYREDKVYFIETNLYDAETDRLLWSAQYQKVNPSDLERASKVLSELAINTMREQNLID